jgi:hypothetical protein
MYLSIKASEVLLKIIHVLYIFLMSYFCATLYIYNNAFQLAMQHCCATSRTKKSPVLLELKFLTTNCERFLDRIIVIVGCYFHSCADRYYFLISGGRK